MDNASSVQRKEVHFFPDPVVWNMSLEHYWDKTRTNIAQQQIHEYVGLLGV